MLLALHNGNKKPPMPPGKMGVGGFIDRARKNYKRVLELLGAIGVAYSPSFSGFYMRERASFPARIVATGYTKDFITLLM